LAKSQAIEQADADNAPFISILLENDRTVVLETKKAIEVSRLTAVVVVASSIQSGLPAGHAAGAQDQPDRAREVCGFAAGASRVIQDCRCGKAGSSSRGSCNGG
jgi:hypothetical protein